MSPSRLGASLSSAAIIPPLPSFACLFSILAFPGLTGSGFAAVVTDPSPPASVMEAGATAPLAALAYSTDGTLLYSVDTEGELMEREVQTSAVRSRFGLSGPVSKLRVLSDGSLLVGQGMGVVTRYAKPAAGKPWLSRISFNQDEAGRQLQANPPKFYQLQLGDFVVSPDEKWLALETIETAYQSESPATSRATRRQPGAKTARIRIWNLESGALGRELIAFPADRGTPRFVWSDNATLTVALPEVALQRFNALSGELKSEWKPPADAATRADPAQEAAEMDRRQRLLPDAVRERLRNRPPRPRPTAPEEPASFGTLQGISKDGKWLLAATRGGLQLWDVENSTSRILERSERLPAGQDAQFSSDSGLLALRNAGGFWLWKTDGAQVGWARILFAHYTDLAFTPGSGAPTVALSDNAGVTRLWNTGTPLSKEPQSILPGYFQAWTKLSATPTGLLAATSHGVAVLGGTAPLRWFENVPLESPVPLPASAQSQTQQEIVALAAAPDGKSWAESVSFTPYSATMSNLGIPRGELRGRDTQTGRVLWRVSDANSHSTVDLLRFLPDGTLLTGKEGGGGRSLTPQDELLAGLQARDGLTGQIKPFEITWGDKVGTREPQSIEILEPSADGKTLVVSSGSGGNGVQFVDLTRKSVTGFFGSNTEVGRGPWATSADGKWLAGSYYNDIGLWNIAAPRTNGSLTPDVRLTIGGQTARLNALKFSATGALAAGLADGRVLLWAPTFSADATPAWETTTGRSTVSLAFSGDGKTLWSGDGRGELKTRDAQSGSLQSTLRLLTARAEGGVPEWVKWDRSGKVVKPTP